MRIFETVRLALEGIFSSKFRSLLTMLGMVIGVFSVVVLVSLGQGAKNFVLNEFQSLGTNLIIVQPGKSRLKGAFHGPMGAADRRLTLKDVEVLEKKALNLEAVSGLVIGNGELRYEGNISNVMVFGVSDKFQSILNISIKAGEFLTVQENAANRRVIVLGNKLSNELFGSDFTVGRRVRVNRREFRVVGVLAPMGNKIGVDFDLLAFIPTGSALRIFNEDKLSGIRAKAAARSSVDDAVLEMTEILKGKRRGEEDFTILTQVSMMSSLEKILQVFSYLLGGIAGISMLVGGIGIMNIMWVSVTERIPEIGIRRAVGARRKDILIHFLIESLLLSLISGLLGVASALILTYGAILINPLYDVRPPIWIIGVAMALSILVGVIFGVWPAYRAAKIETLEALRYE